MRAWVLLPCVLALAAADAQAPVAASEWWQQGGDMGRSSVAALSGRTLDVVAKFDIFPEGKEAAPVGPSGMVTTPHGLVTMTSAPPECALVVVDPEARSVDRIEPPFACASPEAAGFEGLVLLSAGAVMAYSPRLDAVLACILSADGAEPPLVLYSLAERRVLWRAGPDLAGPASSSAYCASAAIDEEQGVAIVPWGSPDPGAGVAAYDLATGRELWRATPSATPGVAGATFVGTFVAATEKGLVINGYTAESAGGLFALRHSPTLVWLDREGNQVGAHAVRSRPTAPEWSIPPPDPATLNAGDFGQDMSEWPAAWGDRAAIVIDNELVVVDVENRLPTIVPVPGIGGRSPEFAPPAWWQDKLVVPGATKVFAVSGADHSPLWEAPWSAPPGGFVYQVAIVPPGVAYALSGVVLRDRTEVLLHRIDLDSGQETMRIVVPAPLDLTPGLFRVQMLPLVERDELLVWTDDGHAALLGVAPEDARPIVDVSDEYPELSTPFTVRATGAPATNPTNVTFAWGDGTVESTQPGEPRAHQYAQRAPRTLRVTAVFADGTTATTERVLRVGEPRPVELTAVQRAFSAENQQLTFFLLGLALTGGGAMFAIAARRYRRRRLERELQLLESLCRQFANAPHAGIPALERERRKWRQRLAAGRLDDAQFAVLDGRAARAIRAWRYRVLGPVTNKLSPHFRQLLDAALDDARVTHEESELLVAALPEEAALTDAERERVRQLIVEWTTSQAALFQATA